MKIDVKGITKQFLNNVINWKEFELFVAELYNESERVDVKHNVTEYGKSGAKRQIDVLVIQTFKFHKIKIIIECKYWKSKVDRPVIDTLVAAIEDLSANKGVVFTTIGYEDGADKYAKAKGIDIFLIRDLTQSEWSESGSRVELYNQIFSAKFEDFEFKNRKVLFTDGFVPSEQIVFSPRIHLSENQTYDDSLNLYSYDNNATFTSKAHLLKILLDIRRKQIDHFKESTKGLLEPIETETTYKFKVKLKFAKFPHKYLAFNGGFIEIDTISFTLYLNLYQSQLIIDRFENADFILVVENYVTKQKELIGKINKSLELQMASFDTIKENVKQNPILNTPSILQITTEPYVQFEIKEEKIVSLDSIEIILIEP